MAQGTSHKKVVLLGLLAGLFVGGVQGVVQGSVWVGVVSGAAFGLVMALMMKRFWGYTALAGLDRGQRRAVSRAMRRGEPVEDPRLARPLVEQVDLTLRMPHPVKTLRVMYMVMGLFGLLVTVLDLTRGRVGGGAALLVIALLMLFVGMPFDRRQRERFRQSREATLRRHDLS